MEGIRRGLAMAAVVGCVAICTLGAPSAFGASVANWQTGTSPRLPSDASSAQHASLDWLACADGGDCTAAGSYDAGVSTTQRGWLLDESGGTWDTAGLAAPLPTGGLTDRLSEIDAVACGGPGECTAAGTYYDGSLATQGLLLDASAGNWPADAFELGLPAHAAPDPFTSIAAMSCTAPHSCTVIGTYTDTGRAMQGLIATEAAGIWHAAIEAPLPSDANTTNPYVILESLHCASAGDCTAIGTYDTTGNIAQGLLLDETNGNWTARSAPLPADASTSLPSPFLDALSCVSAGDCTAGGSYSDDAGHTQGVVWTESDGNWSPGVRVALPPDAPSVMDPQASINAISCAATGSCAAAGTYLNASGVSRSFVVDEQGGAWGQAAVVKLPPFDAATDPSDSINAMSCESPGDCDAIGSYQEPSGAQEGLLLSEFDGSWGVGERATVPVDAWPTNPQVDLNALWCASRGRCVAVGSYQVSASDSRPLLMSSNAPAAPTLVLTEPQADETGFIGEATGRGNLTASFPGFSGLGGTITFTVFGPEPTPPTSCDSGGTVVGTTTVGGANIYNPPAGFTPNAPGNYWWYASYGGDASDLPATSTCGAGMPEIVVPPTVDLSTLGGLAPGAYVSAVGKTVPNPLPSTTTPRPGIGVLAARVRVSGTGVTAPLRCDGAGPCRILVKVTVTELVKGRRIIGIESARHRLHRGIHRRGVTIATLTVALRAGQHRTVRLRLDATGRRLLARFHRIRARLTVVQSGHVVSSKTITLAAPKRRHRRHRR